MERDAQRTATARDQAVARVRRLTAGAVAVCVGSTLAFAGLAAGSTHLRKVVAPRRVHVRRQVRRAVQAPAPPLVPIEGASSAGGGSAPPPAPAPNPATQAPVVVSGGS